LQLVATADILNNIRRILTAGKILMSPCQTFIQTLRSRGYRITPQRELIISAVAHHGSHVNAEQVFAQVHKKTRSLNLATVYRTLDLLVEEGLASRLDLGQEQVIYAAQQHGPHIHLVCRQCGQVIDADQGLLLSLNSQLAKKYHFAADLQHVSVPGLCSSCQEK
jgi:Fur family ferric uptake transcriptional regulator